MRVRNLVVLAVIVALVGCTITYYRYDGQVFHSSAAAFAAQQENFDAIERGTERRSTPVANHARVIVPNKTVILEHVGEGGSEEIRDYLVNLLYNQFQFMPRAIKKRNLFERVDVEQTSTIARRQPIPGVITIYFGERPDAKTGSYFYASETIPRALVDFDPNNPDKVKRYRDFLDRIEALALSEKKN